MAIDHPIDAEIREWLQTHAGNKAELSVKVGHSASWLHKYVNGVGHATIDDLVRLAAHLFGMNVPVITDDQRELLKACRGLDEGDLEDVIAFAKHRSNLPQRSPSKGSNAPVARTPQATGHKGRGKR